MTSSKRRQHRGITLLEVLATMAILLLGIGAAMLVVTQTTYSNRRSLSATQAQLIAEQTLENITQMGCSMTPPCSNLVGLDGTTFNFFQTSAGKLRSEPPPTPESVTRQYLVVVDVDIPSDPATIEPDSAVPAALIRDLTNIPNSPGNLAHVRVTVSWREQERSDRQVVVLQTRMAP